jgi:glycosyltransferase involved in cell wall biosynthesis
VDLATTEKQPIIAVSYSFPPLNRPRGVQVYRLLNGLAAQGHSITLFHAEPRSALGELDQAMLDWKVNPRIQSIPILSYNRNPILRGSFRIFPRLRWFPDEFSSWIIPAYLAVRKYILKTDRNAVVCSFSNPWSDHIVGAWLKDRFNLPWIAHFSDPWAENPYPHWGERLRDMQRRLERKVVNKADRTVFVSDETRDMFVRSHGDSLGLKSMVIPHIMAPEWEDATVAKVRSEKMVITHTGDVYGMRSPAGLLEALQQIKREAPDKLARIKIQFIGKMEPIFERLVLNAGLSESVSLTKPVTIGASLRYMREADVLLVLEGKTEGQSVFLPSKLIEYMGSGHPIFGLTPHGSTSAKIIHGINGLVADPMDVAAIRDCLLQLLEEYDSGDLCQNHRYGKESLSIFTQQNAAERFSRLVQESAMSRAVAA